MAKVTERDRQLARQITGECWPMGAWPREMVGLGREAATDRIAALLATEREAWGLNAACVNHNNETYTRMYGELMAEQEKVKPLVEALERIASYGEDGICPYGCDTPHIARAALAAHRGVSHE